MENCYDTMPGKLKIRVQETVMPETHFVKRKKARENYQEALGTKVLMVDGLPFLICFSSVSFGSSRFLNIYSK